MIPNPKDLFNATNELLKTLKDYGIHPKTSAILNHADHKIQFRITLKVGSQHTKIGTGINFLKSKIVNKIELDSVESVAIFELPTLTRVEEQIAEAQEKKTFINLSKLMEIKTEEVVIQYEKQMTNEDLSLLVPYPHIFRNPIYPSPDKVVTPIEITLDYANTWINRYESFKVRNIQHEYYLQLQSVNINNLLPLIVKTKLNDILETPKIGPNQIRILNKISTIFAKFETDEDIQSLLPEVISTDKPANVEFLNVYGKVKSILIRGYKVNLPKSINVMCSFNLDDSDLTLSAKLTFDVKKLNSIVTILAEESKVYVEGEQ